MNTERRHELGDNTLAKGLTTWGERARPYTSALLLTVAALLGVYIIASLWNSYQATRDRAAWDDYQLAVFQGDAEQRALQRLSVSEDHAGTEMQEWALMGWADNQLKRSSQLYLTNREEAFDRLTDISGVYEQFAETASNPEIRNRARLGLGRVSEMKNNLKEARAQYARVEGALAEIAAERIKDLESEKVAETAAWLATVTLPKPTPPKGPGTPGARPGFEAAAPAADAASSADPAADAMEDILGGLGADEDATRYGDASAPAAGETTAPATEPSTEPAATEPAATEAEPTSSEPAPGVTEPAPAATESAAEKPAEQPAPAAAATPQQ